MALGAFLAGLVVGRSDFSVRAASEALPMRDAFAVLFFVSVGMLLDPAQLLEQPRLLAATLGHRARRASRWRRWPSCWRFGYPLRVGLAVAVALAQIGEFSFIVAKLGRQLGVLSAGRDEHADRRAPSSRSRSIRCCTGWWTPWPTWWSGVGTELPADEEAAARRRSMRHRAVVVGYGPVGRTVTRLLRENEIAPTVIELNMDTVKDLEGRASAPSTATPGTGDARTGRSASRAQRDLHRVGHAAAAEETIRLARELNPRVQILARTAYLRERDALRRAGADRVFGGRGGGAGADRVHSRQPRRHG